MAIAYYDKAIIEKLSNWTKNTQITITSPNETKRLFETIADKNNDKPIKLPLLALTRNLGYNVSVTAKKPLTFNGMTLDATMPKSLITKLLVTVSLKSSLPVKSQSILKISAKSYNPCTNIITLSDLPAIIMPPYTVQPTINRIARIENISLNNLLCSCRFPCKNAIFRLA